MVKLFCAIVGVAGNAFPVVIDAGETVGDLKKKIKGEKMYQFPADELQLFLAKTADGTWLTEADVKIGVKDTTGLKPLDAARSEIGDVGLSEDAVRLEIKKEEVAALKGPVNVLVKVPGKGKRSRRDGWLPESFLPVPKKQKAEEGEETDCFTRLFVMRGFPPLAHKKRAYKTIVERESYVVIFTQLLQEVKTSFEFNETQMGEEEAKRDSESSTNSEPGMDTNLIVTGNPGTGKSRFYLYCIFQLILREREDVKQLPPYELVVNFGNEFHKYDAASDEFVELNDEDVRSLRQQPYVLRLVEATSTYLVGWSGVSILFASPGVHDLNDFKKVDGFKFIMPTWSLEELIQYNSLLPTSLQLAENDLVSRYDTFGGIPQSIFTRAVAEKQSDLNQAISLFGALKIISQCRSNSPVNERAYSHHVLQMVPTRKDFRAGFYLDFLSKHIAELVIDNVHGESLDKVSEFAVARDGDDSGTTSVVRGKIYEMLCHRWFSPAKATTLQFRHLDSTTIADLTIPLEMPTVRFTSLDQLQLGEGCTYYRPTSKTFRALDAFIWDGCNKCYGLQMTLNEDHGIKAAPLNTFLTWLKDAAGINTEFYFVIVVPSNIADSYRKQSVRTNTGAVNRRPGAAARVNQFVTALDVFGKGK